MPDTSFHFLKRVKKIELQDNEISNIHKGTFQVLFLPSKIKFNLVELLLNLNFNYWLNLILGRHSFLVGRNWFLLQQNSDAANTRFCWFVLFDDY